MADDFEIPIRINEMWNNLAEQLAGAIPDIVIEGKPEQAIRWATCAEACFWKATGEANAHDVKDVLPAAPLPQKEG